MIAVMGSLQGIQSSLTLLQFNLPYFKRDFQCQAKVSKQGLQLIKIFSTHKCLAILPISCWIKYSETLSRCFLKKLQKIRRIQWDNLLKVLMWKLLYFENYDIFCSVCVIYKSQHILTCPRLSKHFISNLSHRNALFFSVFDARNIQNTIHFIYYVQLFRYWEWLTFCAPSWCGHDQGIL